MFLQQPVELGDHAPDGARAVSYTHLDVYKRQAGIQWAAHAVLLARHAESIDERELRTAPELFVVAIESGNGNTYPFLERHQEGGGRSVLARVS